MKRVWVLVLLLAGLTPAATVKSRPCTGGVEAAKIRVDVQRPQGGATRSLQHIKRIEKGSRIIYKPVELPQDLKNNAKVALVLSSAEADTSSLTILEFKPAAVSAEWTVPFRASLAVFVLGPQGLDEKRVNTLVTKDDELINALADYAEQTAEIEDTVETLTVLADDEELEPEDGTRLDRSSPTDQALFTLLRALNTSLLANNPMGGGKRIGPVTMMNKATVGFFENAGGLIPGGGALSEIKPMLLPDTDFRAAFVQQSGESLSLCVPRLIARSRNRQVYVWARRVVNVPPPALTLSSNRRAPIGARSQVAVKAAKAEDWRYADRILHWSLTPVAGGETVPVRVRPAVQGRYLDLDLRGFPGAPGKYRLRGEWDWDPVNVAGDLELGALGDLKKAQVTPSGVSPLVEGTGMSTLLLDGTDFQFVEKVTLRPVGGQVELAQPVQFLLPQGRRTGAQQQLQVEVDTRGLHGGPYLLAMQQSDGRVQEVAVQVLPNTVQIDNLPLRLGSGGGAQRVVLRGSGLDKLMRMEVTGAEVKLEPRGRTATERVAVITLDGSVKKGARADVLLQLEGSEQKRKLSGAVEVTGPRPRILNVKASTPANLGVAMKEGELASGIAASFQLQVEAAEPVVAVSLQCGSVVRAVPFTLTGPGVLFLTTEPGTGAVSATVETADGLVSEAIAMGNAIRVPRVESIRFTGEKHADGTFAAILTGRDLETIEKTGWSVREGVAVLELPTPLAGLGIQQLLRVSMPWPSPAPQSAVHVWLRGESEGRATGAKY